MNAGVMRVEDLLRSPALQLRLIAGAAGLSRRVAWAHVSELADPTPWLAGAEMIMTTGMAIPRDPAGQRGYLELLDDAGVACLAVSEGLFVPELTDQFRLAADERGFPVVEVPIPVPFIAISQQVAAATAGDNGQRLNAQLQVFGAVRWLAEGRLSTAEVFARLERLSGYSLYACTPHGDPLLDGVPVPSAERAGLIPGALPGPPTVPGGYVLPVSGPRRVDGFILAIERPDSVPAGVSVVQHIATVAALRLSMLAHEKEVLRREGAETLAEMLRGVLDEAAVARRLRASGFPPDADLVLAIIRPSTDTHRDPVADAVGHGGISFDAAADALGSADGPRLILRQQDELYLLLPAAEAQAALPQELPAVAGISRPFKPGGPVPAARREAQWAVTRAVEAGRRLVRYGDDRTGRWLTTQTADLRALVADVLGAAADYDCAHGADLIPTVRTWLEHDKKTEQAAQVLHIHPNTLLYRVRRFEQITGRSLASTEGLAEVWLALRTASHGPARQGATPVARAPR